MTALPHSAPLLCLPPPSPGVWLGKEVTPWSLSPELPGTTLPNKRGADPNRRALRGPRDAAFQKAPTSGCLERRGGAWPPSQGERPPLTPEVAAEGHASKAVVEPSALRLQGIFLPVCLLVAEYFFFLFKEIHSSLPQCCFSHACFSAVGCICC